MSEHRSLNVLFELYGLFRELVILLEYIHSVEPIDKYLGFRRDMEARVLSIIVSRGVSEEEIPRAYLGYDRSSNDLKEECGIMTLHRECLYYCEKLSVLASAGSLDLIAMGEYHRHMIGVIKNHMDDLFIISQIEDGLSESEARHQLAIANQLIAHIRGEKPEEAG